MIEKALALGISLYRLSKICFFCLFTLFNFKGGTTSGEHGVGVGKMKLIEKEHGHGHIGVQRAIKLALDPKLIMNPDKIFVVTNNTCDHGHGHSKL